MSFFSQGNGFTNRLAKSLDASDGGRDYLLVNSTSVFYPQGVQPTRVCRITNNGAAQTNAVNIYDSATPNNPAVGELVYSVVLGVSGSATGQVDLQLPLKLGLAVKMAGALTSGTAVLVSWV